jgi:hypothetical protein
MSAVPTNPNHYRLFDINNSWEPAILAASERPNYTEENGYDMRAIASKIASYTFVLIPLIAAFEALLVNGALALANLAITLVNKGIDKWGTPPALAAASTEAPTAVKEAKPEEVSAPVAEPKAEEVEESEVSENEEVDSSDDEFEEQSSLGLVASWIYTKAGQATGKTKEIFHATTAKVGQVFNNKVRPNLPSMPKWFQRA